MARSADAVIRHPHLLRMEIADGKTTSHEIRCNETAAVPITTDLS